MENSENYKVIFLGSSSVGKSSIILRLIENKFSNSISVTLGASYLCKEYEDQKIKLNIWDTCGQERFKGINTWYYRDSDVIIFVIDSNNKETFEGFELYYKEVQEKGPKNPILILLFNKTDLLDDTSLEDINQYIENYKNKYTNIKIIEKVSALNGNNINEIFINIVGLLEKKDILVNNITQSLVKKNYSKKRPKCCQ